MFLILQQLCFLLFKRKNGANNTSGGYGSGTEPGNEGRPDGTPDGVLGGTGNGGNGTGGDGQGGDGPGGPGGGGPIKYSLGGRRVAKKPVISTNSNDVGIVVVNITVDRQGNVIKAEPGARGTTTLNLDKLKVANTFKTGFANHRLQLKVDSAFETGEISIERGRDIKSQKGGWVYINKIKLNKNVTGTYVVTAYYDDELKTTFTRMSESTLEQLIRNFIFN
jgi:hypothetical protein